MFLVVVFFLSTIALVDAGPFAAVACASACNAGVVTCYSLAGLTFGTVTLASAAAGPPGWFAWFWSAPAAISAAAACSAAQGVYGSMCSNISCASSMKIKISFLFLVLYVEASILLIVDGVAFKRCLLLHIQIAKSV
jgi:hypothetical protein